MAVLQETKLVLGAGNNGGDSDALQLFQTSTKVFVHFANGVAGTLTVKHGATEDLLITEKIPDGNDYLDTVTGSIAFGIDGPGLLVFGCADIDGVIRIIIEEIVS